MALPPQVIKLKRKRGDEPVDTLFIERHGDDVSSKQGIDRSYKFRRIPKNTDRISLQTPSEFVNAGSHQDLKSIEDARVLEKAAESPVSIPSNGAIAATSALSRSGNLPVTNLSPEASLKPRRVFHLSKERASARLRHSSSASSLHSLRGIRKHGRLPYGAVAVISEQKKAQRRQQIQRQISLQQLAESKQDDKLPDDPAQVQTQKRPNASAAERKWRHEHWTKSAQDVSMKDDTPHDDSVEDEASLALAAELQQFAMQESAKDASAPSPTPPTEAQTPRLEADEDLYAQQLRGAKPLKYQPKPQPPRNREPPAVLVAEDPEDDWVYDTYVREYHDPMSAAPDKPMIDASQPKPIEPPVADNVGYLVIRTEDEEAWEELMSDGEGSEEERWEDEDDSNAEDYYGNDYPEDEDWVGSDYGNDSEYGSQDDAWSDEGEK